MKDRTFVITVIIASALEAVGARIIFEPRGEDVEVRAASKLLAKWWAA